MITGETVLHATTQSVFDIVSDLSRHKDLVGSGDLANLRILSEGPTALGSMFEANESIHLGGEQMEFSAECVVVSFGPPNTISRVPISPFPPRRIRWWYHLTPEGQGTKVVDEVEVDLSTARDMMVRQNMISSQAFRRIGETL